MKTARALAVLALSVGLLVSACGGRTPTSPLPSLPAPNVFGPSDPSPEVLTEGEFVYPAIPRITAEEMKRRLDRKDNILVIDNRSDYKFQEGHLHGAVNIPDAIDSPYPGAEDAMDTLLAVVPNGALKVLYCD